MNKLLTLALVVSIIVNTLVVGSLFYMMKNMQPPSQEQTVAIEKYSEHRPLHPAAQRHERIVISTIDSMRHDYAEQLYILKTQINQDRREIIPVLLEKQIDHDKLDSMLIQISKTQEKAEKLTIEHIIDLKDELDKREWVEIVEKLDPAITHKRIIIGRHPEGSIEIDAKVEDIIRTFSDQKDEIEIQQ